MRLLNTTTIKLEEFQGGNIPNYAILSHVWGEEEVLFQDLANADRARGMKGFSKITSACEAAVRDGLHYLWVDTCCINKESSAELSEAINSMFLWYKDSRICYALLSDVPSSEDPSPSYSSFATSEWFARGWTLQELLAPRRVIFYGSDWVEIGTKATLQDTISAITGINCRIIVGGGNFRYDSVPIAVRMSWAAERRTTRVEDIAYCLMGLFDVNMPLLYGEGRKAFIRLQHEIIKKSNDQSIFAWKALESDMGHDRGFLARSPSEFYDSNEAEKMETMYQEPDGVNEYAVTNRGIRIKLPILHRSDQVFVRLNCRASGNPVGISLKKMGEDQYVRVQANRFVETISISTMTRNSLFILDDVSDTQHDWHSGTILLKIIPSLEYGHLECVPWRYWEQVGPDTWKFGPKFFFEPNVLVILNPSRHEQCVVPVNPVSLWADIFTNSESDGDAAKAYVSYFGNSTSLRRPQARRLDRSSVDLPSGWTAHLIFGIAETSPDGEVQQMTVEFRRTPTCSPSPTWNRPSLEKEVIYLVACPAAHHGFKLLEDSSKYGATLYGYWPQNGRSFILGMPHDSRVFEMTFENPNARWTKHFFLVLRWWDSTLQSTIETWAPGMKDRIRSKGKVVGETCSETLRGGQVVSMTIRRNRDTSVADFIVDVSIQSP